MYNISCLLQEAIDSFLHYLYWDKLDPRTSPEHAIAVLHVAHYYGAACLVGLCEALLAKVLKKGDRDDEGLAQCLSVVFHVMVRTKLALDLKDLKIVDLEDAGPHPMRSVASLAIFGCLSVDCT